MLKKKKITVKGKFFLVLFGMLCPAFLTAEEAFVRLAGTRRPLSGFVV